MAETLSGDESREQRLERVLADYLRAEEVGQPLIEELLLAEHPDLAEELASFFRNRSAMQRLAEQVQPYELPTLDVHGSGGLPAVGESVRYFGDYELLAEIARGGMGVVYKAKQNSLNRIIALKMVLAGSRAAAADLARFRQEAEAAARLDHPHIVPVYEVGEHEGLHYYTMKLVEGGDLTTHLPRLLKEPKQAVKLVETVARAIHFAHQHGILHRDLKPANILIDGDQQPQVTDFGLARLTDSEGKLTQTGALLGTPGYMAPEQIRGEKLLTTAADVYSLGAILFACLTGKAPFGGSNAMEVMVKALDSEAPSPRSLNAKVDRNLETICKKALERDPARRYASAGALADDLARWLRHEPIEARPVRPVERTVKWVRRHPAWSAAIALACVVFVVIAVQWRITRSALDRADTSLYRSLIALAEREWLAGDVFDARKALSRCPENRRGWEWDYARRLCYVTPCDRLGNFEYPLTDGGFSADGSRIFAVDQAGTAWVWDGSTRRQIAELKTKAENELPKDYLNYSFSSPKVALWPDGKRLAVAFGRGRSDLTKGYAVWVPYGIVKCFDVGTQTELWTWQAEAAISELGVAAAGQTCVVVVRDTFGRKVPTTIVGLAAATGEEFFSEPLPEPEGQSYSSAWFKVLSNDRLWTYPANDQPRSRKTRDSLAVFDATNGERLPDMLIPLPQKAFELSAGPLTCSSDGRLVIHKGTGVHEYLEIRRVADGFGTRIETGYGNPYRFAFSADSQRLAYFAQHMNLDVDDLKLNDGLPVLGPMIAMAPKDDPWLSQVHVADTKTGKELALLRGLNSRNVQVRFSPDGKCIMAFGGRGDGDPVAPPKPFGEMVLWNVEERATARVLNASSQAIHDVAISPDGKRIVTAGEDTVVRVWDVASGALVREITGHESPIRRLSFDRDGNRLLVSGRGKAVLFDGNTGTPIQTFVPPPNESTSARFGSGAIHPTGNEIAFIDHGRATVVNAQTGQTLFEFDDPYHEAGANHPCYSPDGKLLAIPYQFDDHGELKIVDTGSGKVRKHFETGGRFAFPSTGWGYVRAKFSPDGRYVAAVGNVDGADLYDLHRGKLVRKMRGHNRTVVDVAFTSDSKRLATGGYYDRTIKLWSVATGEEVHTLRGHEANVTALAFSSDDSFLVSADESGVVRIWEAK